MIIVGRPRLAMDRAPGLPDRIALDRESVRRVDHDGRLHVAVSNISKANICGYRGSEIPGADDLGLEPDRIYQLLRDPEELAKAAATSNNIPVLSEHVPVTAEDNRPELVVGSTGTDAAFDGPYLRNSLVIWDADAISKIESGDQRELSCAYRYTADMTPGEFQGAKFDGIMRDILLNHVCLVKSGRAGADVVVGDEALPPNRVQEKRAMALKPAKKPPLSRRALAVSTALGLALKPRLAQDAQIDIRPLVEKITAKNWKASKPKLLAALKLATDGKLAADADIADVVGMLDMLDEVAEEADMVEAAVSATPVEEVNAVVDADPLAWLEGKLSPEEMTKLKAMMAPAAADEKDDDEKDDKKDTKSEKDDGEKKGNPFAKDKDAPMDKKAMDAALAKTATEVEASTIKRMRAVATAQEMVRPFVGALDSDDPAEIYKAGCDHFGIPTEGVDPSAYGAMVKFAADNAAKAKPVPRDHLAMDAAAVTDFQTRYPGATRFGL